MTVLHRPRRFVRALWPASPRREDIEWVRSVLTPAEYALWAQLPAHDRRYSIRVGRRLQALLAGSEYAADPHWVAVALLHDVGKLDAGLSVPGRALATAVGTLAPRIRGSKGRLGRYLRHDDLGAEMIRTAGGREAAARWAAAHHRPDRWAETGIPVEVATALRAADDA